MLPKSYNLAQSNIAYLSVSGRERPDEQTDDVCSEELNPSKRGSWGVLGEHLCKEEDQEDGIVQLDFKRVCLFGGRLLQTTPFREIQTGTED